MTTAIANNQSMMSIMIEARRILRRISAFSSGVYTFGLGVGALSGP